jgi:hemerythrin superfamily protein
MRTLASELEIHEYVEDHIFYPAVHPVSEDVPLAHSEHRQLADLLARTLKLSTSSLEFEEHLRALHAAMDHHAGSEETSMFREAQRLGDARLRDMGQALERMLEEQRTSRAQRMFHDLKIRLLEGL